MRLPLTEISLQKWILSLPFESREELKGFARLSRVAKNYINLIYSMRKALQWH